MGRIFARMGTMYAWATTEYILDRMSFEQILMYYDYGLEAEEMKSNILVNCIAVGLFGAKEKPKPRWEEDQTPDREAFYKHYGDHIQRPEGGAK